MFYMSKQPLHTNAVFLRHERLDLRDRLALAPGLHGHAPGGSRPSVKAAPQTRPENFVPACNPEDARFFPPSHNWESGFL